MGVYTGHGGSIKLFTRDSSTIGGTRMRPLQAGIAEWRLQVQWDSQHVLLPDPGGHRNAQWFPLLRTAYRMGGQAEAAITGYWDSDEDPFAEPARWVLPDATTAPPSENDPDAPTIGASYDTEIQLKLAEELSNPRFYAQGRTLSLSFEAQVRGIARFEARISIHSLDYRT